MSETNGNRPSKAWVAENWASIISTIALIAVISKDVAASGQDTGVQVQTLRNIEARITRAEANIESLFGLKERVGVIDERTEWMKNWIVAGDSSQRRKQ